MEWVETREMAVERARLRNHIENDALQVALSAFIFGLIPTIGIPIAAFVQHRNVMWGTMLIFVVSCSALGSIVHLLKGWNRANRMRIALDSQSVTLSDKGSTRCAAYSSLVGFYIFDLSCGKLLVFGEATGRNLAIGIPPEVSVAEMRAFFLGKLSELSNQEMPKPRNPYEGR